jgi:hypothetical protein
MIALRVPPRERTGEEPVGLDALAEGLRFVWRTKMLLGAITIDLFAVLLGGGRSAPPIYARDILDVGPIGSASFAPRRQWAPSPARSSSPDGRCGERPGRH